MLNEVFDEEGGCCLPFLADRPSACHHIENREKADDNVQVPWVSPCAMLPFSRK